MAKATAPDVEHLVNDYADLLNGDFSKLDVLDESFTYHSTTTPEEGLQGPAAFGEFLKAFGAAFPDLHYTLDSGLTSDEVTMQEWTMVGTHEGEFEGIPPTNREVELTTMTKTAVSDGRIQEVREYYDPQTFMVQLGVTAE